MMKLPAAFEEKMRDLLGEEFPAFAENLEKEPVVSIRLNPYKFRSALSLPGVPWAENAYVLPERPVFTLDPLFHAGAYYVQEANSMFLEQVWKQHVKVKQDLKVLDLCAAPGGKSTHLLSLMQGQGLLVTNEVIKSRAGILDENIRKWGCYNVVVSQNDPDDFSAFTGYFDVVLVDAPCSGEGLFRKDEAARGEWSEENVELCSLRQNRILSNIWPVLKPGGILIYSTCTYNRQEDEDKVDQLIQEQKAELLQVEVDSGWQIEESKGYKFFPHRTLGEGFFISALKKPAGEIFEYPKIRNRKLQQAGAKSKSEAERYVKMPENTNLYQHKERVVLFPGQFEDDLEFFLSHLHVWNFGLLVGEVKGREVAPSHELAISPWVNQEAFTLVPLDQELSLSFQQKNTFSLPENIKGQYALFQYQGVSVGIGKIVGNRFNNQYPKEWRIRMNFKKDELQESPLLKNA